MQKNKNYSTPFITFAILSIFLLLFWKIGLLNLPIGIVSKVFSGTRGLEVKTFNRNGNLDLIPVSKLVDQGKLERENQALSDQFAMSSPSPKTLLPTKVIGAPSFIPGVTVPDFFILDKGKKDGVKKGQAVVVENNLVGKITDTNLYSSKVTLVSDPSISFTGKLPSETVGVVKGMGDSVEIGNILLSENIKTGDLVLTKGDQDLNGVGNPPDLVVGKIVSVEKKPSDLFQKAQVQSLLDFTKINTVFVVIK